MFYGARRDVPDLRRPGYLPLYVSTLQLRILQLVSRADPLASDPVAETKGIENERAHLAILAHWPRRHQYER